MIVSGIGKNLSKSFHNNYKILWLTEKTDMKFSTQPFFNTA